MVVASCAADPEHANLARCTVALDRAGSAEVRLTATGAPERSARTAEEAARHELLVWGLRAGTTYRWAAGDQGGELTTGALPEELAGAVVEVAGRPFGFDAVLQVLRCNYTWLVMLDGEGRIVWYHQTGVYQGPMDGYAWLPDDREVVAVNGPALEVVDLGGRTTMRLVEGEDFDGSLHHDATRWGDLTYALFEEPVGDLDVDGFHVWDGDRLVGSFRLGDPFDVPATGQGDWSHANGLNATDDGLVVMSLRNFDTVLAVDGDPASPTFLQVVWSATGSDPVLGAPTFAAAAGPLEGFHHQHNASLHGDRLWLFDNEGDGVRSRAARYVLDGAAGEVRHEASWFLEHRCDIQSGALPIDGGVLTSCATTGQVAAFRDGEVRPGFTLEARCGPGLVAAPITRAFPVDFDR